MKYTKQLFATFLLISTTLVGCTPTKIQSSRNNDAITPSSTMIQLEEGLSVVRYDGDYGFDVFIAEGGASNENQIISYLENYLSQNLNISALIGDTFGCSTIFTRSNQGYLFGRNFDWQNCEAMILESHPDNGYASISTVNVDFITQGIRDTTASQAMQLNQIKTIASLYAPLDGMNEKGLAISINMIADNETIQQNTDLPDITTTTAIRLILDHAATVDEAISLLQQYDLHASFNMMIHFAIADASGRSVVVEYINNQMTVTDSQVVTNFYLSEGDKYGIGSRQSHQRYTLLENLIQTKSIMTLEDMKNALDSVSKHNFNEYESTEWSVIYDLYNKQATYYHRENYEVAYTLQLH